MWIFVRYQKELPATRAAVLYCVEPVFAALLALWILREPMTVRKAAGAAVIVAGNLVCELFKRKP
jgi:drug/metabolite transporter (DMT)-like permease